MHHGHSKTMSMNQWFYNRNLCLEVGIKRKFFIFKKGKKTPPLELEMYIKPEANANKRGDWLYDPGNQYWYRCSIEYGPAPRKNTWEGKPASEVPAMHRAWVLIL